jgi:hypothetical protein
MTAMNSVGLLFRELPVGVRLRDDMTLRDLFSDVQKQVQKGIEHCCYPYVDIHNQAGSNEAAYLLYQQDIRDMSGFDGMDIETIDIRQNQAASQTILDMEILDGADGLVLMIDYTASLYDDKSMDKFKDLFIGVAHEMVANNSQSDITVGELRGKVLLFSRDAYATNPIGGFITGWAHQADYVTATIKGPNSQTGTLYVQDFYEVLENMMDKLNEIHSTIRDTNRDTKISEK